MRSLRYIAPHPKARPKSLACLGYRAGQPEPALREQPAGQDICRPVHAQVDAARPDQGSGQQGGRLTGPRTPASTARQGSSGERAQGGVLRGEAETFRLGQPARLWWPGSADNPRQPAPRHRTSGDYQAGDARGLPPVPPSDGKGTNCQQCADEPGFRQAAHRPGRGDAGRGAPALQPAR